MGSTFSAWACYINLKLSLMCALHLMLQATTHNNQNAL